MLFESAVIIVCTVFLTSILSGVLGMAGGMILMGVLLWLLPVPEAMILHATAQFFANGSRAYFHRQHIRWKTLPYYFSGMFIVLLVASLVAFVPPKIFVFIVLGIMPFAAYALPKKWALDFLKPVHAAICGAIVTLAHVTAGVSGPLLDIFFQSRSMQRHENVATKAFTQASSHIAKFIYFGFLLGAMGAGFSGLSWAFFIAIVFAALCGTFLSRHILARINDGQFYRVTQIILFIIGAVYLVKAVWLMFLPTNIKPQDEQVMIIGSSFITDFSQDRFLLPTSLPLIKSDWPAVVKTATDFKHWPQTRFIIVVIDPQWKDFKPEDVTGLAYALRAEGRRPLFLLPKDDADFDKVFEDIARGPAQIDYFGTYDFSALKRDACFSDRVLLQMAINDKSLRDVFDLAAIGWHLKENKNCQ